MANGQCDIIVQSAHPFKEKITSQHLIYYSISHCVFSSLFLSYCFFASANLLNKKSLCLYINVQITTSDAVFSNFLHCLTHFRVTVLWTGYLVRITPGWFAYILHRFTSFDIEKRSSGTDSVIAESLVVSHIVMQTIQHMESKNWLELGFTLCFIC